jgi:predicted Zn-dependent peptidase
MIEESELQKVKNKAESTIVFNEVELLSRSSRLAYYAIMGDASRINHESALIQAITPTQIRSMAQTVFTPKKTSTLYYLSK